MKSNILELELFDGELSSCSESEDEIIQTYSIKPSTVSLRQRIPNALNLVQEKNVHSKSLLYNHVFNTIDNPCQKKTPRNPFSELGMSVNNEEIESDMIHIRGPKKREECKIMRISLRLNDEEKREEQNLFPSTSIEDWCNACLQTGELLCCDKCPRVFHGSCTEEGFNIDTFPKGNWECKNQKIVTKRLQPHHSTQNSTLKSKTTSFFDTLLNELDKRNPEVFSLPNFILTSFPFVWKDPRTGNYINKNTSVIEILYSKPKSIRNQAKYLRLNSSPEPENSIASSFNHVSQKSNGTISKPNTDSQNESYTHVQPPFFVATNYTQPNSVQPLILHNFDTLNQVNAINQNQPSILSIIPKCHKCNRSNSPFTNQTTSFYTFQPPVSKSPFIKCDDCDFYWHLDCLDPPLCIKPPQLRPDGTRFIETYPIPTWLKESLLKRGWCETQMVDGTITGYSVREKWQCPLHSTQYTRLGFPKEEETARANQLTYETANEMSQNRSSKIKKFVKTDCGINWNPQFLDLHLPTGFGKEYKSRIRKLYETEVNKDTQGLFSLIEAASVVDGYAHDHLVSQEDSNAMNWISSVMDMQIDIAKRLVNHKRREL